MAKLAVTNNFGIKARLLFKHCELIARKLCKHFWKERQKINDSAQFVLSEICNLLLIWNSTHIPIKYYILYQVCSAKMLCLHCYLSDIHTTTKHVTFFLRWCSFFFRPWFCTFTQDLSKILFEIYGAKLSLSRMQYGMQSAGLNGHIYARGIHCCRMLTKLRGFVCFGTGTGLSSLVWQKIIELFNSKRLGGCTCYTHQQCLAVSPLALRAWQRCFAPHFWKTLHSPDIASFIIIHLNPFESLGSLPFMTSTHPVWLGLQSLYLERSTVSGCGLWLCAETCDEFQGSQDASVQKDTAQRWILTWLHSSSMCSVHLRKMTLAKTIMRSAWKIWGEVNAECKAKQSEVKTMKLTVT